MEGSIALTKVSEKLGYHKYWLAEHHSSDGIASISPEILIKRIVTGTSSIRVGSGGIMLSHCSPCKVTEIFRISEAMFLGRIDLGIGVAPNSNHTTTCALAYGGGQERVIFQPWCQIFMGSLQTRCRRNVHLEWLKHDLIQIHRLRFGC